MAIIVISHQMGAGGPEIGTALAQRLGYRYVNQELLLDAARRYGLAEAKLSHLEESKPTLFERFDTEKAGRMRYLYEVDIADPTLYELIINTEKLRYDAVVDILERLVRRPEMATTEEGRRVVASRALASRVQVALATHPETRRYRINVEAQGDVVTLEGTTALDRAVDVAQKVPGVREVRTQQVEIPPIPPFVA